MATKNLEMLGAALGSGIANLSTYTAQAAAQANAVSAASQSAQGAFNQHSANLANAQNMENLMNQYRFNSAQALQANQFTEGMWERTAAWNEEMWQKQADFNAQQAQIQRDWQERMSNTAYQRGMKDMEAAGLNPILAYSQGGAQVPGGAQASVGGAQMSSAQGAMASGGLLGANSASEGNFTGQMQYMSDTLGLISAILSGISSATEAAGGLGEFGNGLIGAIGELFDGSNWSKWGKGLWNGIMDGATEGKYTKNKIYDMKKNADQKGPIVIDSRGTKKK